MGSFVNLNVITVPFTSRDIKRASEFADRRVSGSSSFYKSRGGGSIDKLKLDISTGLLAEICLYKYFKSKGIKCTKPDTSIHSANVKSYSADMLVMDKIRIHCKSQTSKSRSSYGVSCLFQLSDSLLTNPGANDFVSMCVVDVDLKLCFIYGFFSAKKLVSKNLFEMPVLDFLRSNKRALYLDSILKKCDKDDRWGLFRKQCRNIDLGYKRMNSYRYFRSYAIIYVSGKECKVDTKDLKKLLVYGVWHLNESGYVKNIKNCTYLHQLVINIYNGMVCDHINRDTLDNRSSNLRLATSQQNSMNKKFPLRKNNEYSSKYKGVSKRRDGSRRWVAYITIDRKSTYIGDFNSEIAAAIAYNSKAKELYGEFAFLNNVEEKV